MGQKALKLYFLRLQEGCAPRTPRISRLITSLQDFFSFPVPIPVQILEICTNSGKVVITHRSVNFIKFLFSFVGFILFPPTASHKCIFCVICSVQAFPFSGVDMAVDTIQIPTSCFMQTPKSKIMYKMGKVRMKI